MKTKSYQFQTIYCCKTMLFSLMLSIIGLFTAKAQYVSIPVTGYNNDIVANGGGASGTPNTGVTYPSIGVDGAGYCLVSQGYVAGTSGTPTCFMPTTNTTVSLLTPAVTYQLQGYGTSAVNNNNALTINSPSSTYSSPFASSGSFLLTTPTSLAKISILLESVLNNGAGNTMDAVVNFSDGSTQVFPGNSYLNWFSGSAATTAFYQFNRVNPTNSAYLNVCTAGTYTTQPNMYELSLNINPLNYGKLITSITFTSTSTSSTGTGAASVNYLHFMAINGLAPCAAPTNQATALSLTTVSTGQIDGSFTAALSAPNGYLVVRYPAGAAETLPANGTVYTANQPLGLGTVVQSSASTTFSATGLFGSTNYDFYIYSYNSSASCAGPIYNTTGGYAASASTSACGVALVGVVPIGAGYLNTPVSGYTSITNALVDINIGGLAGATILELQPSYTSAYAAANETYPITFASNACITSLNTLTIRPEATVAASIDFTSANATASINFNGGDYVIIDGRPGGIGTTSMMSIANTNLGASPAVQFINDASNNIIQYCTVMSVNNSGTSGSIFFGSTNGATGNDNNVIDHCSIQDGATKPVNGIYSNALTTGTDNSGNSITNCNISNYFAAASTTAGINLNGFNNAWTITGNKLFQTANRIYTTGTTHYGITIQSGSGYTISGNTIGYADALGNGYTSMIGNSTAVTGTFPTAYTVTTTNANTTRYAAINCAFAAGGTVSNIQGNNIGGIALYTSSGATTTYGIVCGIQVTSGNANIGTTTGNTIGSTGAGLGSIYALCTTTGGTVVGIYATSANTVNIQNNSIGSIDASGSSASVNGGITGIDAAGTGTFTISNNTVGNATAGNMRTGFMQNGTNLGVGDTLKSTTGATGALVGIRNAATGNVLNMNNNTVRGFITSSTVSALTGIINSGAATNTINLNNNFIGTAATGFITYSVANSGALVGISNTGAVAASTNLTISNNDFRGITYSVAGSGSNTYINNTGVALNFTVNANTFTNLNVNTTGTMTFVSHTYTTSTGNATKTITNNSIVTGYNKAGASGSIVLETDNGSSVTGTVTTVQNNNYSNITVAGTTTITGINLTDGGTTPTKTITGNVLSGWTAVTGAINAINITYMNGASTIANNTITNITGQAAVTGMTIAATINTANPLNITSNTINNLTSTGTGGAVTGISCTNTSPVINITSNIINTLSSTGASAITGISIGGATNTTVSKNKIYDLSGSNASSTVNGILVSAGTLVSVNNNLIGDLRATVANAANPVVGLNITGGTTVNASYNTVRLNATSSGAIFGSSAISVNATPTTVNLRNNIFINTSTANTTGLTVAHRRAGTALTNYGSTSNNNIFYAGTAGANNLIFTDGTNNVQNLLTYKALVTPMDGTSGTENTTFLSTAGSSANFLHVDGTVASITESGAVNITGITDDYDGHIRFGNAGYPGGTAGFPTGGTAPDMGADEYSGTPAATLAAPINFAYNSATTSSYTITWNDNSIGEAGFIVTRSLNVGGPYSIVGGVASTTAGTTGTTYSLAQTGLLGNTTYYYQIVATNATNSLPLAGTAATLSCGSGLSGVKSIPGDYPTLTAAVADLVLNGMIGPVILELDPTYTSAAETFPITFGNNIGCLNGTNTVTVRPKSTVSTPLTITSANATATIDINGANFITFDGRPGGTGSSVMLSVINTNAAGVAMRLTNDASNNTIKYCDVQGQNTNAVPTLTLSGGVIFINSANSTNLQGNDNNTITYCNVHGTGATVTNFPAIGIAAFGTSTLSSSYNDNCTVTFNNIYDYSHTTLASTGIKVDAGNTAWNISNNKFYQTTVLNFGASTTLTHRALWVTPNTGSISNAANGFTISNNYIGGNAANGSGMYTMTGTGANTGSYFIGMDISVGLGIATTIQNNTITNCNVLTGSTSSAAMLGISVANGVTNITGNTIGSATSNAAPYAITFTTTGTLGGIIGIRASAGGAHTMTNNIVAGINLIGSATTIAPSFNGLNYSGGTSCLIDGNTVGSSTLPNSIILSSTSATSTSASAVRGIISNVSAAASTITNNTVANITTNYAGTGSGNTLVGIAVATGSGVVTGNTINNLRSASQGTGSGSSSAILGIVYTSTTAPASISSNTIHTLKLTNTTTTAATQTEGIFYTGPTTGTTNVIQKNFIHSFAHASATNSASTLTGMDISTGLVTIKNNMIRLGIDDNGSDVTSPCIIRGISENSATSKIFNNSIYIGGNNIPSSTSNTFAYQRSATTNADSVINNIFVNNRSNAAGTAKHYQVYLTTSNLNLTLSNNVYNGIGVGNVFGYTGTADAAYLPNWVTGDVSQTGDPIFLAPTDGAASVDMHLDTGTPTPAEGNGLLLASVTDDYDGQVRSSLSPNDIGADADNFTPIPACSGTPLPGNAVLTSVTPICGSGTKTMSLAGYVNQSGLSYKWQQSATGLAGSFTDVAVGGNALAYTTPVLTTTTYYRCRINCSNSGDSNFSSILTVIVNIVNPVSSSTTSSSICSPGSNGTTLSASGASTYAWSPVTGLTPATGIGASVNASPSATTSYVVVGTDANGCTASSSVLVTVVPGISLSSVIASPSNICQFTNSTLTATLPALSTYCAATNQGSSCITNVTFGSLNNSSTCAAAPAYYDYYPTPVTSFTAGTAYTFNLTLDGTGITSVWIDYNQNGTFETTEWYQPFTSAISGSIPITIPLTALNGQTRMRVRSRLSGNTNGAGDACLAMGSGETEDYIINITGGVPNNPASFLWSPSTYLTSTTTSSTTATSVAATTTYTVTATAANGCTTTGTAVVNVSILTASPTKSVDHICPGTKDTIKANATGGGQPYTYSWTSSAIAGVVSTNSQFVDSPSVTTTYTVVVSDACLNTTSATVTVIADIPTITSTTPGSRCGYGTVNLAASASGFTVKWYANASGGSAIGVGPTFTTPTISSTTTYYAAALAGSGLQTGLGCTAIPTASGFNAKRGIQFDAYQDLSITSFDFPAAYSGTTTMTVELQNSAGTVLQTYALTDVSTNAALGFHTVPVNIPVLAGTGYKLLCTFNTGSLSNYSHSTGANYTLPAFNNLGGAGLITNGLDFGPVVSTTAYYYFYNLSVSSGCSSARIPVVATVNPAPTTTVTAADINLCPGGTTTVSVSSSNPAYTYSWTSDPAGFTASGTGPHSVSPTGITKYYVLAQDNSGGGFAGCANLDSVTVNTASILSAGLVSASQNQLCVSGTPTLTAAGAGGGGLQWQSSTISANGPWTNVGTGLVTYTPSVNVTTYYRMQVMCQTTTIYSNVETVTVTNPQLSGTTPGSRCGTGPVNLSASVPSGTNANWYANATGGTPLATNTTSFTTPSIINTTTFYVAPSSGGFTANVGMPAPTATSTQGFGVNAYGLVFNALNAFTLNQVTVYPVSATSGTGTVQINLQNSAGTVINSATVTITGTPTGFTPQVVNLNFAIPVGSNYKLTPSVYSGGGITSLLFGPSGSAPGGGNYAYPFSIPGVVDITTSTLTAAPANTANPGLYYYFYNWSVSTGCEGPRVPVVATVVTPPAVTVSSTSNTLCNGQSATLSVTSSNPNYTYTWNPGNISGASTVVTPSSNTVYSLTAVDNSGGAFNTCATQGSSAIVVNPVPTPITITPSSASLCLGGSQALSASGGTVGGIYTAGTGTTTTSGTGITPYSSFYEGVRVQYIIQASELTALGMVAGNINSMAFNVSALGGAGPYYQNGYTIKMAHTNDNTFTTAYATPVGSLATVYGPTTQGLPALGWNTYTFSSPFSWDGSSNVLIDICHDNDLNGTCATCYTTSTAVYASTTSFNSVYGRYADNLPACGVTTTNAAGPGNIRPDMRFNSQTPTALVWSPSGTLSAGTGNNVTATPLTTTTYNVVATNVYSCSSSNSVVVTVNVPTTTSTSVTNCGSYLWNGTTYTTAGTYTHTYVNGFGCNSTDTLHLTLQCTSVLNLTAFIEGYWDGSAGLVPVLANQGEISTATACDTIAVDLIDPTTLLSVSSVRTILNQDGTANCIFTVNPGSYYIAVGQRSAVRTWSANPVSFGPIATTYDFTSSATQAYGDNQLEIVPGVFAFYSGDIVVDDNVDLLDLGLLESDISTFAYGYLPSDINGDGNVDLLDSPTLEANISNFIYSNHP